MSSASKMSDKQAYLIAALLLSLCVLLIIGINVLYYRFLIKPVAERLNQPPSVSSVMKRIDETVSFVSHDTVSSQAGPDITNTIGVGVSGYDFKILIPYSPAYSRSYAANSTPSSGFMPLVAAIDDELIQAGFKSPSANSSQRVLISNLTFVRSDALCQVVSYSVIDVSCAERKELTSIAKNAEPFVTAYNEVTPNHNQLTVGLPTTVASLTHGYERASLAIFADNSETVVNYYKSPTTTWRAISLDWYNDPSENATITPNCADFESLTAVALAYKGQTCYDSASRRLATI